MKYTEKWRIDMKNTDFSQGIFQRMRGVNVPRLDRTMRLWTIGSTSFTFTFPKSSRNRQGITLQSSAHGIIPSSTPGCPQRLPNTRLQNMFSGSSAETFARGKGTVSISVIEILKGRGMGSCPYKSTHIGGAI